MTDKVLMNKNYFNGEHRAFTDGYYELLINRITHSTMSLEKDLGNPDEHKNAIRLRDMIQAFKILLSCIDSDVELSEEIITHVADTINASSQFISNGYRETGDHITDTEIPISLSNKIKQDMELLISDYNGKWNDLEPFTKEALFHITFIRIHPFEDGNGRTGRLLLNYNLLKNGIAPVIITDDLIELYEKSIKDFDIDLLANIFKVQSIKENEVIEKLYDEYSKTLRHLV